MLGAVLLGIGTGLSLAAPPGPMNAIIAREASRHSVAAGIRAGLGAPVADVLFLIAVLLGLDAAQGTVWFDRFLAGAAAVGVVLLTWLAISTARARPARPDDRPTAFWAGFGIALTNPYQIGWWLSGGVVLVEDQGMGFFVGLLAGIFGWVVGFSIAMHRGSRRWDALAPLVQVLSADLLLAFAIVVAVVAFL